MSKKIVVIIILSVAAAAAAFAAVRFGPFGKRDPKLEVLLAVSKTYAEVKRPDTTLISLLSEIIQNKWDGAFSLSVNKLEAGLFELEPQITSALGIFTLNGSARRDTARSQIEASLGLQLAVTQVAELLLYFDKDLFAASVPKAYGNYITVDPRRVADEWDASILGDYFGPIGGTILQDPFYEYYKMILFSAPKSEPADRRSLAQAALRLDEGAKYVREDKEDGKDVYSITLPGDSLNAFMREIFPLGGPEDGLPDDLIGDAINGLFEMLDGVSVAGDVSIRLYVEGGKVSSINFEAGAEFSEGEFGLTGWAAFRGKETNLDDIELTARISNGTQVYLLYAEFINKFHDAASSDTDMKIKLVDENTSGTLIDASIEKRWDKSARAGDNLSFQAGAKFGGNEIKIGAGGFCYADDAGKKLDVNLRNLSFVLTTPGGNVDASVNLRVALAADEFEIDFDESEAVRIGSINEFDVLLMIANLLSDSQLGPLLDFMD
ncbi:MAG: hypothetical protein FWF03_01135 [Defluviitaleaceae bacterium]|nr:hypothetical protein [Defluviitaleaceae bacterium]